MPPYIIEPVPIQLDQPRTLRFDNAAIQAAERQLQSLSGTRNRYLQIMRELIARVQANDDTPIEQLDISWTEWSILAWAGIQHEAPMPYDMFSALVPFADLDFAAILTALFRGMFRPVPMNGQGGGPSDSPLETTGTGDSTGVVPVSTVE